MKYMYKLSHNLLNSNNNVFVVERKKGSNDKMNIINLLWNRSISQKIWIVFSICIKIKILLMKLVLIIKIIKIIMYLQRL